MNRQEKAYPIFQECAQRLAAGTPIEWGEFEMQLRKELDIGYQDLKRVVIDFHNSGQFREVCKGYAQAFQCAEFHEILGLSPYNR